MTDIIARPAAAAAAPAKASERGDHVFPPLRQPVRGDTSVRFTDADHPDRAAHVAVEGYEGPLGLLLGLIEQRDVLAQRCNDGGVAVLVTLTKELVALLLDGRRQ